jgi:calcineurin-like phosphoesterase family protein
MADFFTSDTHFGHAGARALYCRPFGSVAEMDAAMVDRWNVTVGAEDEVWHLGDFALGMSAAAMAELLARLHGRKHLITGNNDPVATTSLTGWSSVQPYAESKWMGSASCCATTRSAPGAT